MCLEHGKQAQYKHPHMMKVVKQSLLDIDDCLSEVEGAVLDRLGSMVKMAEQLLGV